MRDELHSKNFAGETSHVFDRLGNFHPAALAAPPRMDLRLDHHDRPVERFCRLDRFVDRERRNAARRGHAEAAQNFLALIFVDLHADSGIDVWPLVWSVASSLH